MMHGFDPVDSLANSTIRYFIVLSISRLPRPYLGFEGADLRLEFGDVL